MAKIAVVFARGGSKGVPGKNIKNLGGKPLIAWSIELAKQLSSIERVMVSTDSQDIADIALRFGAEVPFLRPAELAADTSAEWFAWRHFIEYCNHNHIDIDTMVSLPATSPFRRAECVQRCLNAFDQHQPDAVISVTPARRHPRFNMVSLNTVRSAKQASLYDQQSSFTRRQDVPAVFDMSTAVYVVKPDFILSQEGLFQGNVIAEVFDDYASIDIDTAFDFEIAKAVEPLWSQEQKVKIV